jgi:DNA-3-methyladenine glycosylase
MSILPQSFYKNSTKKVARDLLGKILVRRFRSSNISPREKQNEIKKHSDTKQALVDSKKAATEARLIITETEAYLGPHDQACHTRRGPTPRTEVMFGPAGFWYIYLIYGMYHCLNIVTEEVDSGSAVLIRGGQLLSHPDLELNLEKNNRKIKTDGPGKLCRALSIDRSLNQTSAFEPTSQLFIEPGEAVPDSRVEKLPRIGVQYAGGKWAPMPLRFKTKF